MEWLDQVITASGLSPTWIGTMLGMVIYLSLFGGGE